MPQQMGANTLECAKIVIPEVALKAKLSQVLKIAPLPVEVGLRHLSNYTSRRMTIDEVAARNRERYVQSVRSFLARAPLAA